MKTEDSATMLPIPFRDFLETHPPGTIAIISDLGQPLSISSGLTVRASLRIPEIQIHCNSQECNGPRFFRWRGRMPWEVSINESIDSFLIYTCSNCQKSRKTFALNFQFSEDGTVATAQKYGELPGFGPPVPSKLIKLIGPDRDLFLQGRRCENQSLGIGAFVYYRRVVENQKNRILTEILKVAEKVSATEADMQLIKDALKETQFSKAMDLMKKAIPQSLLINGQNPLTLLHTALSDGLHDRSDEHCLDLAHSIRLVLSELSDRLSSALKDEAELNNAVNRLANLKK